MSQWCVYIILFVIETILYSWQLFAGEKNLNDLLCDVSSWDFNTFLTVNLKEVTSLLFFSGLQTGQYDQNMRWLNSSLCQGLLQYYTLLLIVMYVYPDSPNTMIPIVATTQGHSPTGALILSNPWPQFPALRLPSNGYHWMTPLPCRILQLSSCASAKVSWSCFEVTSSIIISISGLSIV